MTGMLVVGLSLLEVERQRRNCHTSLLNTLREWRVSRPTAFGIFTSFPCKGLRDSNRFFLSFLVPLLKHWK